MGWAERFRAGALCRARTAARLRGLTRRVLPRVILRQVGWLVVTAVLWPVCAAVWVVGRAVAVWERKGA